MRNRQLMLVVFACAGLAFAGFSAWRAYQRRQHLLNDRMQPPAEVLAFRESIKSPFTPGLDREERRRRWREHGEKLWNTTTLEQKLEIADGYFPQLAERLKLTQEQVKPVHAIYMQAVRQMVEIWKDWTRPNFDQRGPFVRSWLLAAEAQQAMLPHLNETQRTMLQDWFKRAKEDADKREQTNAKADGTTGTAQAGAGK